MTRRLCALTYLATGGGPIATVWDCSGKGPAGRKPIQLQDHNGPISVLAYQHAGPVLASGGADGRVALWCPGARRTPLGQVDLLAPVVAFAWSPDDRSLAVGDEAGSVGVVGVS